MPTPSLALSTDDGVLIGVRNGRSGTGITLALDSFGLSLAFPLSCLDRTQVISLPFSSSCPESTQMSAFHQEVAISALNEDR